MLKALLGILLAALAGQHALARDSALAPTGTLRAAYIVSNLAQATRDQASGEIHGVSADIAREIGRREQVPVSIHPLATAAAVLEAVQTGAADIGFVAPNSQRMVVLYSRTYMRVQQSALVRADSQIQSVAELDRDGQAIGANAGDSVSLYMKTNFKHARVLESADYELKEGVRWLQEGVVVAFGGNRQRLRVSTAGIPGLRLLPDNLYGVPQAIAVPTGRPDLLALLNAALGEMRASGFLQAAVERSGVDGIAVAADPDP